MTEKAHRRSGGNRLLEALPHKERDRLMSMMRQVSLERGRFLITPNEELKCVYFPLTAMISLVSFTEEGRTVETGVVGSDGMLGIPVLFGTTSTPMQSVVQIPGLALEMPAKAFKQEFDKAGPLNKVLLQYLHVLMILISQTAACNKLHPVSGRLARWLLLSSDCIRSNEVPLSQEFLATMLGVRRAGVNEAAGQLREEGLIRYHQGMVVITDRRGLEDYSCECYDVVKREATRFFAVE